MEQPMVTAVTHAYEARVTLTGLRDEPGVAGRVFSALADANVNVDMIIQNEPVSDEQKADLSFTVASDDLGAATDVLEPLGVGGLETDPSVGKVSIVGAGMRSHPGVAAKVFQTLGEGQINIEMISTSPIKISCVIAAERVPDAVRGLHQAFDLGATAVREEDPSGEHRPRVCTVSYRVGVVGATGAVGATMLEVLAERGFPASEVVPFASERSAGPQAGLRRRRDRVPAAVGRVDRRARPGALLGRRRGQRRVGAALRRGRRGRGRQHQLLAHARRRAAGRRRGQPRRARGPQRDHREPELLDDADDGRAGADPARGRDRADRLLHLPVGVGHRPARLRRAAGPVARHPRRRRRRSPRSTRT